MQTSNKASADKGARQVLYAGGPKPKNRRRFDDGDPFQHVNDIAVESPSTNGAVAP
jgi:hypothetical protein